jgi:hypothetical protein
MGQFCLDSIRMKEKYWKILDAFGEEEEFGD